MWSRLNKENSSLQEVILVGFTPEDVELYHNILNNE